MRKLSLPAAVILFSSACFYPADRGKALEDSVQKLEADNSQMAAALKDTQEKLSTSVPVIDQKIREVTKALDNLDRAAHRSDADIGIQLQKTVEDVAQLRGQVETYLHKIDELQEGVKQIQAETEEKLTALKGEQAKAEADAKKRLEELQRPSEPRPFLALANDRAKGGDLVLARKLYAEFVKKWPKDPLVPDAFFGLGETFYTDDKCREALAEYGKVVQTYAKSKIAPDAWLRSADCFKKLGMDDKSHEALEEIIQSYPKAEAAKTAKVRLADLKKPVKKAVFVKKVAK